MRKALRTAAIAVLAAAGVVIVAVVLWFAFWGFALTFAMAGR